MLIFIIICIVGYSLLVWYAVSREREGIHSRKEALALMGEQARRGVRFLKNEGEKYWLRQNEYLFFQNILPFERQIQQMGICRYFNMNVSREYDPDIWELHFTMMEVNPEYRERMEDLRRMLQKVLQDFYRERLGSNACPLVYATHLEEGQITFWIGRNAYGNRKIQERVAEDERLNQPNQEELLED